MHLRLWMKAIQDYFTRARRTAVIAFLATLLVGGIAWYFLQNLYSNYLIEDLRHSTLAEINVSEDSLSSALERRIGLAEMLQSFTRSELDNTGRLDMLHLATILEGLYNSTTGAEFLYLKPLQGEMVLYPHFNKSEQSYNELEPRLKQAWEQSPPVETVSLLGPYLTSIGQRLLAAQATVFHNGQVWGTVTVAFNLDEMLSDAGYARLPEGWGLRKADGTLLAGSIPSNSINPVEKSITLPGGNWELLAAPPVGWRKAVGLPMRMAQWGGALLVVMLAVIVLSNTERSERLKQSVSEKTNLLAVELTERQRMTEALRQSEEQNRLIVDSALDAIFIEDAKGNILDCNDAACQMYGYSHEQMIQLSVFDLVPPEIGANLPILITKEVMDGLTYLQSQGLRHSGEVFPTEINIQTVMFDGQQRVIVYIRDLTERQRTQRMLAESEARYRSLMEILPEGVILTDLDGVILFCNQHAAELHEFINPEEMIGHSIYELVLESDLESATGHMELVRTSGNLQEVEFRIPRRAGGSSWSSVRAKLIPGVGGQPPFLLIVEHDITQRHLADDRLLLESTALEAAANGIVITDPDGTIVWVNPAFTRLTGYTLEEALSQNPRLLRSGQHSQEFYKEMWGEILNGHVWRGRMVNRRKNGNIYTEEMTITPVFSRPRPGQEAAITHFVAIKQDVTEREQLESRQAAIAALSSALRSATGRREIIEIMLNQAQEVLESHGAALMLKSPQTGRLVCAMGVGAWSHWEGVQVSGQTGATARVLKNLTPFVENNIPNSTEPLLRRIFKEVQAVVCVPLIAPQPSQPASFADIDLEWHDQVLGVVWVGRSLPFLEGEVRVLSSIADISASAIHRASLYDETRQRLQRLMAIHAVDAAVATSLDVQELLNELLKQLTGGLGVDAADVMLVSADGWMLQCAAAFGFNQHDYCDRHQLRLGEGLAGRVAEERKTLIQGALNEEYPPVDLERLAGEDIVTRLALPMLAKGELKGVLEVFYRQSIAIDPEWLDYLETLARQAAIAIDNAMLFEQAQSSNQELAVAYDTTLEGWARALELRDRETEGHTRRAAELTIRLGERLGVAESDLVHMWRGALLHDIGKLGIPDEILGKPGPLDETEWEVMRRHPRLGYELIEPIPYLRPALDIPWCHHEWWDGSGYPRHLKGEEIPLAARIFAVADVWDALRSDRPYRSAWSSDDARAYIQRLKGVQFDPQVVEVFEHLLDMDARIATQEKVEQET